MLAWIACLALAAVEPFAVTSVEPPDGATDVPPDAVVRFQFARPIDPKTLTPAAVRLSDADGRAVPAFLQTDLTGGVVTLTPTLALSPGQEYRAEITPRLRGADGETAELSLRFRTSERKPRVDPRFVHERHKVADRDHNSCVAVGPDGHLYVADTFGELRRYRLDADTGLSLGHDVLYHNPGEQIVGLCFDPGATAERPVLWVSSAWYGGNFSGTIARLELPPFGSDSEPARREYVVGLPHDAGLHHQPNGIAFGPDGRLYQAVGGTATLGGSANWGIPETPLSACVIVADVRSPRFNGGRLPCDVTTAAPNSYDPSAPDAPVRVYATGLRNAYDLCWHSGGHLFSATNQNSIPGGVSTPASPDGKVPAITAMPDEMLYRVRPGKYYGHPNPSRGEYVLNGGNPTPGRDPFEVPEYPVGVKPEPNFDADSIYNLRPGGGNSANGMDEFRADGPLKGRLMIAYFSGAKTVQTFEIDADGRVRHEHPLIDAKGNPIRFRGAIDVAVHPTTGRVYVADFGDWERPNFGHNGAVWMLQAAAK